MDQPTGDRGGCKDQLKRRCLKSLDRFRSGRPIHRPTKNLRILVNGQG
jgi:hypothetical protein